MTDINSVLQTLYGSSRCKQARPYHTRDNDVGDALRAQNGGEFCVVEWAETLLNLTAHPSCHMYRKVSDGDRYGCHVVHAVINAHTTHTSPAAGRIAG